MTMMSISAERAGSLGGEAGTLDGGNQSFTKRKAAVRLESMRSNIENGNRVPRAARNSSARVMRATVTSRG